MQSYIKKSTLIREFRMQVNGKAKRMVEQLDNAFFETINRVFRKKPHDVKFHITKENTLVFNMDFGKDVNAYLEYIPFSQPTTIMTLTMGVEYSERDRMEEDDLSTCLSIIEESLPALEHDSNPTNP